MVILITVSGIALPKIPRYDVLAMVVDRKNTQFVIVQLIAKIVTNSNTKKPTKTPIVLVFMVIAKLVKSMVIPSQNVRMRLANFVAEKITSDYLVERNVQAVALMFTLQVRLAVVDSTAVIHAAPIHTKLISVPKFQLATNVVQLSTLSKIVITLKHLVAVTDVMATQTTTSELVNSESQEKQSFATNVNKKVANVLLANSVSVVVKASRPSHSQILPCNL